MDLASLGLTIDSSGLDRGTASMVKLTAAARATQSAAGAMGGSVAATARLIGEQARANDNATRAINAHTAAIRALTAAEQRMGATAYANRAADIAAYGRALDDLRAKFNPAFAAIRTYRSALDEIRHAHRVGAISSAEMAAAIGRERREALASIAAYKAQANAAVAAAAQVRAAQAQMIAGPNAFNTAGIAAQFQDVAITASMGMSPLMIGLQQGTQLVGQLSVMGAQMGKTLAAAFLSLVSPLSLVVIGLTAGAAALIQWVDWTKVGKATMEALAYALANFADEAAIAGAALALTFSPAILGAVAQLTAGVLLLGKTLAVAALTNPFGAMIAAVGVAAAAIYMLRDDWQEIFNQIGAIAKKGGNLIIGVYVFVWKAIKAAWENLPGALLEIAARAANGMIDVFNMMLRRLPNFLKEGLGITLGIDDLQREADAVTAITDTLQQRLDRAKAENADPLNIHTLNEGLAEAQRRLDSIYQKMLTAPAESTGLIGHVPSFRGSVTDLTEALKKAREESFQDYISQGLEFVQQTASDAADALRRYAGSLGESEKAQKAAKEAADRAREAYADIVTGAQDFIRQQELERAQLTMTAEAYSALRYQIEMLQAARDANLALSPAQFEEIQRLAGQRARAEYLTTRDTTLHGMQQDAQEFIRDQEIERQALGLSAEAASKLRHEQELLNEARRAGIVIGAEEAKYFSQTAAAMARAEAQTEAARTAMERAKSALGEIRDAGRSFAGDFVAGIQRGEGAVKSLLNALNNLLARLTDKLLDSIFDQLFAPTQGNAPGAAPSGLLGGLFRLFGGNAGAAPAAPVAPLTGGTPSVPSVVPSGAVSSVIGAIPGLGNIVTAAATAAAVPAAQAAVAAVAGTPGTGTPSGFALPGGTIRGGGGAATLAGSAARDAIAATATGAHGQRLAPISLADGRSVLVNADYAPNFQGLVRDLEARGYVINSLGGYNNRNIAGTNTLSNHAFGNAIDINPSANPHLKDGRLVTDIPDASALAQKWGLGWGGNWRSSKDAMHFEVPSGGRETALAAAAQHTTTSFGKAAEAADKMAESGTGASEALTKLATPGATPGGVTPGAPGSPAGGAPSLPGLPSVPSVGVPGFGMPGYQAPSFGDTDWGASPLAALQQYSATFGAQANNFVTGMGGTFQNIVQGVGQIGGNFATGLGGVFQNIVGALSGAGGGGGGGGIGGLFGSLFKGIGGLFGGGGFSSIATGLAAAGGGLFADGAAFSGGSVVSTPTLFRMAGGRMGMMGEAGDEGVLPLAKRNGRLGVINHGGGGGVTVIERVVIVNGGMKRDGNMELFVDERAERIAARGDARVSRMIQPTVDKRLDDKQFRGPLRSPTLLGG
jgi:hypothetical protein